MNKAPAFQFYADTWLSDFHVRSMSNAARGVYVDLLAFCWLEHGIPDNPEMLARVLAQDVPTFEALWAEIRPRFYLSEGLWQHKRLDAEREKQRKFRRSRQLNGRKGGRPVVSTSKASENLVVLKTEAKKSSPSPTPSPSPKEKSKSGPLVFSGPGLRVSPAQHAIVRDAAVDAVGKYADGLDYAALYREAAADYATHGTPEDLLSALKKRARLAALRRKDKLTDPIPSAEATRAMLEQWDAEQATPEQRKAAIASMRASMAGSR